VRWWKELAEDLICGFVLGVTEGILMLGLGLAFLAMTTNSPYVQCFVAPQSHICALP
jgi:hypothetical protein